MSLKETKWLDRLKLFAMIFCAVELVRFGQNKNLDHLHVHSCANAAHLAAMAKVMGGCSYSLTLHGDPPVYGVDHYFKAKGAKFVSVVANPLQKAYQQMTSLPSNRVPIVTMGVDAEKFIPLPKNGRKGIRLITVARLHPVKGHLMVLEAMKTLVGEGVDCHYTIVGLGPYEEEIRKAIVELGLGERVVLTGTLGEEGVMAELQKSDVFILPSFGLGEASPVSVMEAMAAGIPVIASIIGGVPDLIESGREGILVEKRDQSGLTEAIRLLANNQNLRRRMGQEARERAVKSFDYRVKAKALMDSIAGVDSI